MRSGIAIKLSSSDHSRLVEIAADRNSPQKHVWRAQIVLLSAQGVGTNEIMRSTGKAKTCVWRWQQRFHKLVHHPFCKLLPRLCCAAGQPIGGDRPAEDIER
jgi:hypothetical protein